MTRTQSEANEIVAVAALKSAQQAIVEGNFWLAQSYLRSAIKAANKAGCKRMACAAMRALQNIELARA